MAQVGVNQEPLHERLVFGFDGDDYRVVKVDTDGNLVVALKAIEDVQANLYGWINSAWQKAPMPFGASDSLSLAWSDTNLAAGTNTLDSDPVPSGEMWVITHIGMRYGGTPPTFMRFGPILQSTLSALWQVQTPASNTQYDEPMRVIMTEGDTLRVIVVGATAGDSAYGSAIGYKIDIDQ